MINNILSVFTAIIITSQIEAVFGVFHPVLQFATEYSQQLWRYRPKVPFHIWVAPRPPFGYKETNATKIKLSGG
ncbi:hypothetical protein [aff. Roholtiella sp. LEGE 12411]|uniref:hypothetical protein n=1 Tax=aff. Roholtiella sp. LEGE 12411 TaxID=1828822 RepID=UPI00188165BB|nr:hypothetical protein [aff. Roholtiella sp. LEGE 12411]MBE9035958.1 hypothetical protein [aff. Roholtiella sp. LEGE 12411]